MECGIWCIQGTVRWCVCGMGSVGCGYGGIGVVCGGGNEAPEL